MTTAKRSLRLLGSSHTAALQRDLQWWMPDGAVRVITIREQESSKSTPIEVETHRIVGCTQNWNYDSPADHTRLYKAPFPGGNTSDHAASDKVILAAESYSSLKTLYAQHIFSAFMRAAAKTMEKPIEGGANIRPANRDGMSGDVMWQSFTLHNIKLSNLAQDIQGTGLGSLQDVYLGLIPPLSAGDKLPRADAIVEWAREHAKPHEEQRHWKEAAKPYVWLFQTATSLPGRNDIITKATALLMEYLRAVTDALELRKAQCYEERDVQELEQLSSELSGELRKDGNRNVLTRVMGLYNLQGRSWECEFIGNASPPTREDAVLKLTDLHIAAHNGGFWNIQDSETTRNQASEKDILEWTPLHYAVASPSKVAIQKLFTFKAVVNARDIRGRTPLHYACRQKDPKIVYSLLREGAEINVRDIDGLAPLHIAATHGHKLVVNSLIESGADVNVVDGSGNTPLHWAAYKGHRGLVVALRTVANTALRDHNNRTTLHLAAIAGVAEIVQLLLAGTNADTEAKAKDRSGRTPLHLAAAKGHEAAAAKLLAVEPGVDGAGRDNAGHTPLHMAATNGHLVVARLLALAIPKTEEARDNEGRTPLHLAAANGHETIARLLAVELGANVGATALGIQAVGGQAVSGKVDVVGKTLHAHGGSAEGGRVVNGGIAHGGTADGASAYIYVDVDGGLECPYDRALRVTGGEQATVKILDGAPVSESVSESASESAPAPVRSAIGGWAKGGQAIVEIPDGASVSASAPASAYTSASASAPVSLAVGGSAYGGLARDGMIAMGGEARLGEICSIKGIEGIEGATTIMQGRLVPFGLAMARGVCAERPGRSE